MICIKDFAPHLVKKGGFFSSDKFENLQHCLERLNHWVEDNQINVMRIETLLFPDMYESGYSRYSKTTDVVFKQGVGGDLGHKTNWHQVFRVWYFTEE